MVRSLADRAFQLSFRPRFRLGRHGVGHGRVVEAVEVALKPLPALQEGALTLSTSHELPVHEIVPESHPENECEAEALSRERGQLFFREVIQK